MEYIYIKILENSMKKYLWILLYKWCSIIAFEPDEKMIKNSSKCEK